MQLLDRLDPASEVGVMNEELRVLLVAVMVTAGLPADSSEEIGFHLALHYPEHAQALLDYRPPASTDLADAPSTAEPPVAPGAQD